MPLLAQCWDIKKLKSLLKVTHDSMNLPMAAMIAFLLAIMAAVVLGDNVPKVSQIGDRKL